MLAYSACIAYSLCMQYTVRNVPASIDAALRERAQARKSSLNETLLEILRVALGVDEGAIRRRDLSEMVGDWEEDPEMEAAFEDQRRIDPELWR